MPLVADYGSDVPKAPLAVATAATVIGVGACWSGFVALGALAGAAAGLFAAVSASRVYAHHRGQVRVWTEILAGLPLRGDERVLDVGCGRGSVLVTLARRLPRGRVVGFHPWTPGDSEAPTRANVVAEGVADRVTLQPGDLRSNPFLDRTFPLVVSSLALHGLPTAEDRARAVAEMWRVLADGGTLLIVDRQYTSEYVRTLEQLGAVDLAHRPVGWRLWAGGPRSAAALVSARRPPDRPAADSSESTEIA